MGRSSTSTVQAPHTSDSQDRLAPVSPTRLRRKSRSTSSTGTVPLHAAPLSVRASPTVCRVWTRSSLDDCSIMSARSVGAVSSGLGQRPTEKYGGNVDLVLGRPQQVVDRL